MDAKFSYGCWGMAISQKRIMESTLSQYQPQNQSTLKKILTTKKATTHIAVRCFDIHIQAKCPWLEIPSCVRSPSENITTGNIYVQSFSQVFAGVCADIFKDMGCQCSTICTRTTLKRLALRNCLMQFRPDRQSYLTFNGECVLFVEPVVQRRKDNGNTAMIPNKHTCSAFCT